MQDPLLLAELLCARICHDVSGPLSSVLAGVEVAAEEAGAASEPLAVALEAGEALRRRLGWMRAAWAGEAGALSVTEFRRLAEAVASGRRLTLDFSKLDPDRAFAPPAARLALNVLLLAFEALGSRGRIAMAGSAGAEVAVTLEGPRAAWPEELATYLADERAAWQALTGARTLQAPLTALLARRCGLRLSFLLPAGGAPGSPAPLLMSLGITR